MKTIAWFLAFLFICTVHFNAHAQSARQLTRRIVNPNNTLKNPNNNPPPTAPPAPPAVQSAQPVQIVTNVVPEKTKEQKEEMVKKTIEFQKQRAIGGAPTAQYDLGMRYLTGDGVEKDLTLAKKWLTASAKNGNSQAAKKVDELKKKESSEK